MSDTAKRKLAEAYKQLIEGTYVEPGHDVAPAMDDHIQRQIAELTDAVDRLQQRVAELERKASW